MTFYDIPAAIGVGVISTLRSTRSVVLRPLIAGVTALSVPGCGADPPDSALADDERAGSFPASAFAAACESWDEWDKPAPPFRIHGDTYHVGTCGISAILVASPDGHLIIDSGTERGGELVAANIEALGFSLRDVRYLTHTQEHGDHVGGLRYLRDRTGARLVASVRAESVFETGVLNIDDPQYEPGEPADTTTVDELIGAADAITLGDREIVAHYTPGHSPGAISWRWEECEDGRCYRLVFTDGLGPFSADGYRWSDHPEYLAEYRESLTWLETVEADICLSAHPSQMRMIERIGSGLLVDPGECERMGASIKDRLGMILQDEGTR